MKIKENFVLQQVAGQNIIVAVAQASVDFNGMLTLNETGAFLWKELEMGRDRDALVRALTDEYDVSAEKAAQDVDRFLAQLTQSGCLEE